MGIPVYEEGQVIGRVKYTRNLDFWDGHNMTCGSTGRHLGITRLNKSKKFVLVHGTQWEGEQDSAEVISDKDAFQAIIGAGMDTLLNKWPDLKRFVEELDNDDDEEEVV